MRILQSRKNCANLLLQNFREECDEEYSRYSNYKEIREKLATFLSKIREANHPNRVLGAKILE